MTGNRARFFAPQAPKTSDGSAISKDSEPSCNGNSIPSSASKDSGSIASGFDAGSNTTAVSNGTLVSLPKQKLVNDVCAPHRPAPDSSEGETVAQRTRIIETETIFNANREGHGRLNVSGLIKHVDANTVKAAHQSTRIKEVVENEELGTRSPRQYSGSKLISKSNTPSNSSDLPHFTAPAIQRNSCNMPPSNQLASQSFKVPSHHTPRSDVATEEASTIKKTSDTSHTDAGDLHISTRVPTDRSDVTIKGLTSAFNKKHSAVSKSSASRFPSPVSHRRNNSRNGRAYSPHTPFENEPPTNSPGSFAPRDLRIESHSFSSEICDGSDFRETTFQGSERYHGSVQEQHGQQEPQRKRGEKRISDPGVDDECVGPPLGKKARIDAYDELPFDHGSNSSMTNSPELGLRDDSPFKKDIRQDRHDISRQDPQMKIFYGQDVDEYVAIHMDRYEAARKHWTECSGEEWEKGADELVDKFTKILDFVKEQMKRRVTLYASLHARIDEHQRKRGETSEMLKIAKSKLVAKTGIVVDEESCDS